eukprot:g11809.t1
MAKRLLVPDAERAVYKMALWSAAGVMGTAVLMMGVAWTRAKDFRKKTIVALTNKAKANQAKTETARSACLEWQIAVIKNREKLAMTNDELARAKKESASAQAQVQVERTERLRLQIAYEQLREQHSKEVHGLKQELARASETKEPRGRETPERRKGRTL